jgi:hypothetical protein
MKAVSANNADFELYELLKNSRLTCSRCRSQQQRSLALQPSRFGVDLDNWKTRIVAQGLRTTFGGG